MKRIFITFLVLISLLCKTMAQVFVPNYDEALVPDYVLPDPLVFEDGRIVDDLGKWTQRRQEILGLFQQEMFGFSPSWDGKVEAMELVRLDDAFDGQAITREVRLTLIFEGRELNMDVLMHLPRVSGPVPLFLGLNFFGNHTTAYAEGVQITTKWVRDNESFGIFNNHATAVSRGVRVARWPAEEIIARGYGLATIYCGDIDPDYEHGFSEGVHQLMGVNRDSTSWGTIAAWAWGLSRALDYLSTDPYIDSEKIIVVGHSRLGKAALWAGATDERFAMAISNNSGCGGAAISRRQFGETVARINTIFPYWFSNRFKEYNGRESDLPVDQHQLIALMAPRPVYVASAEDDRRADPKGEFLACLAATPVYQLFGLEGLPLKEMPLVNEPAFGTIGYHIRPGVHDITVYDWLQYIGFADKHFKE